MIKRLFPEYSNQFNFLKSFFSSFKKDFIDRLEMFFPMWCMFAFQHYLIKSFDIGIFSAMEIVLNKNYLFSLIKEDWIGVSNIIFHTCNLLWLKNAKRKKKNGLWCFYGCIGLYHGDVS